MCESSLILIAGPPGTGKSHLVNLLIQHMPEFQVVSIDKIKERLYDEFGFDDATAKEMLDRRALSDFFETIESLMRSNVGVISEYPFSSKQATELTTLCERYYYRPLTVRFGADLEVLYERQRARDLDSSRHAAHVLNRYHFGDRPPERATAPGLLTFEEFQRRCSTRGYDTFALGPVIQVDTTDFSSVDYGAIITQVRQWSH